MRSKAWKWTAAICLSGVVHAGAAILLLPKEPEMQVAGGQSTEIALAGTAFSDLVAAGTPAEIVAPSAETAEQTVPVEPEAPVPLTPVEPSTAEAAVYTAEPVETDSAAIAPSEPSDQASEVPSETSSEIEPATAEETVTAIADVPLPTPRPDYEPPERKQQVAARPPQQQQTARSSGSDGHDERNASRGNAGESAQESAAASNVPRRASRAGNAAVSNYPGKISSRLRRALRYPREARRRDLKGEVYVAFTVTGNGSVSGIGIVRSSGSPILDRAAIETVQRAAPFPAIPEQAGRSSWPFTIPLAFVR